MARRRRSNRKSARGGGFSQLLLGLGLGLAVAAGVYFSDLRSGDVGSDRTATPPRSPAQAATASAQSSGTLAPAQNAATSAGRPAGNGAASASGTTSAPTSASGAHGAQAGNAAARPDDEPGFDFYELLPRYEVVVPEVEQVARPAAPTAPVAAPGSYILQAGSFRSLADADRMQASLALLGIEAHIQKVAIDSNEFHRVRVGPISNLDELNRIRASLRQSGIESLVMKVD